MGKAQRLPGFLLDFSWTRVFPRTVVSPAHVEVSCPQCGADTPSTGRIATSCRHCETLLVLVDGGPRRAQAFDGHLPRDGATVALICRFCAGALPESLIASGGKARCEYCGQRPELPPTLLALLKVLVTHPSALPPVAKRLLRMWAGFVAVFAVLVGLYVWLPEPKLDHKEMIDLRSAQIVKQEGGRTHYTLQARSSTVEIHRRGNTFPYLNLQAWDFAGTNQEYLIKDQRMRLLVTVVREATGERRSQWVEMYHGARWRPSDSYPEIHPHIAVNFVQSGPKPLPVGRYHLEVSEAVMDNGPLPNRIGMEWSTWSGNMNFWFIMTFNVLAWIFLFDLRGAALDRKDAAHFFNRRRLVATVLLLWLAVEVVYPLDPFGTPGVFEPRAVPGAQPALPPSSP